jgi:non-reducing end alpha-L-arabinofuranosidase
MTKTTTQFGGMAARFPWTSLWVCMVCACGTQPLVGGSLLNHDASGSADQDTGLSGSAAGGAGGTAQPSSGLAGSIGTTKLPCDIYADDGGPCVAAHSTVRALLGAYDGPLYQVRNADGTTKDIGVLTPGGFANSADQDEFCGLDTCTISIIYDQSGKGNHLTKAPPGEAKRTSGNEADAKALPITISGHNVYGEHNPPGVGYRNYNTKNTATGDTPGTTPIPYKGNGTATGDDPETIYMIASGDYYNGGCCFDYGNGETNSYNNGEGAVEAVNFGSCSIWGKGAGSGPWVMGDLENGLWPGNVTPNNGNTTVNYKYVTAMVKGDKAGKNHWTIKAGNAQSGSLTKMFDGPRPDRYNPMKKEGGIVLGTGGDNSNSAQGNFFEGIMTAHYSSDAADNAVQANIVSVYGQ